MIRWRWIHAAGLTAVCLGGRPGAQAESLVDLLQNPQLERLELSALAPVLAATVASTYPVASASSSVTYAYNPALDTFERQRGPAGPILGERAVTIGRGQVNLAASYSHVQLTRFNGQDLNALVNQPTVNGRSIVFPVPGGVTLANGTFTNFLPVEVFANLDVRANIFAPSVTYGVTPDLDVNLTVPVVQTALDVTADTEVPDPRLPQFALPPGEQVAGENLAFSDSAAGVGDVLLRAKYVFHRGRVADLAAGLALSLPTGNPDNFQGTGYTIVTPGLIASRVVADRFQPLVNVGIDLNCEDVGRSVVRWAIGGTVELDDRFTAAIVFLGRDELAAQADPITDPFFFQIERNDTVDGSFGLRYRFAETAVVAANVVVPMNLQGLRPDFIPTVEVEYVF